MTDTSNQRDRARTITFSFAECDALLEALTDQRNEIALWLERYTSDWRQMLLDKWQKRLQTLDALIEKVERTSLEARGNTDD